MKKYSRVLLATDLMPESSKLAENAFELAKQWGATLTAVHVVDFTPMMYGGGEFAIPLDGSIEDELSAESKQTLAKLGKKLGIPSKQQWIVRGQTKDEIIQLAQKLKTDLIIVGGHDKNGLELLFGSTANAIIQAMPCDVLTIKL